MRSHVKRFALFLRGRLHRHFAVRRSFFVIPVDRSSEDGRWHGISDVSQRAPLSTISGMVACHSKQPCLRAQLGTPGPSWPYRGAAYSELQKSSFPIGFLKVF